MHSSLGVDVEGTVPWWVAEAGLVGLRFLYVFVVPSFPAGS